MGIEPRRSFDHRISSKTPYPLGHGGDTQYVFQVRSVYGVKYRDFISRKSMVTRSGDRTHADIRPLELKSNALTTRPSWCIKWKCFLFPMILEWTPGQGSIQAAWSVLLQSKFFRICNLCGSISQKYHTLLRPVGLVV